MIEKLRMLEYDEKVCDERIAFLQERMYKADVYIDPSSPKLEEMKE